MSKIRMRAGFSLLEILVAMGIGLLLVVVSLKFILVLTGERVRSERRLEWDLQSIAFRDHLNQSIVRINRDMYDSIQDWLVYEVEKGGYCSRFGFRILKQEANGYSAEWVYYERTETGQWRFVCSELDQLGSSMKVLTSWEVPFDLYLEVNGKAWGKHPALNAYKYPGWFDIKIVSRGINGFEKRMIFFYPRLPPILHRLN